MTLPASSQPNEPSGGIPGWILGLGLVAGLGGLMYAALAWMKPPAPAQPANESVTAQASPYLNTVAGVRYVGDEACAGCHATHTKTYHGHPMGRSLATIAEFAPRQEYTPQVGNPFDALGMQFRIDRRGNQVTHEETARDASQRVVAKTEAVVAYAIGSGTHACSYLIQREGSLTQSPITWYTQKRSWDLSPGFQENQPDRFERPIAAGCLFCHSNQVEPEPDTLNTYRQPIFNGLSIGCERCHGPGELHVQARRGGQPLNDHDFTIVNPGRLEPALRDDVCAQCHLGGKERVARRGKSVFDYRPGLPLESTLRVFVWPQEATQGNQIAGHVEQMHGSQCFQKSAGKMGCISCHDPHAVPDPAEKETYFRNRCLQCHQSQGCSVPLARRQERTPTDNCAVCHMPREGTNINHVALTDHRILRTPPPRSENPLSPPSPTQLLPFGRNRLDLGDSEMARDIAVATIDRARVQPSTRQEVSRFAGPLLVEAVRAHPDDLNARESLAVALAWSGNLEASLAMSEGTLERAPRREMSLSDAGVTSQKLELNDRSLAYWQRALAINPASSRYRFEVASLLALRGDWDKAVAECKKVLEQNGSHISCRLMLVHYHLKQGDKAQARVELETVLALKPPNAAELRKTYAELLQ